MTLDELIDDTKKRLENKNMTAESRSRETEILELLLHYKMLGLDKVISDIESKDLVNHPEHYLHGEIETIDIIKPYLSAEEFEIDLRRIESELETLEAKCTKITSGWSDMQVKP